VRNFGGGRMLVCVPYHAPEGARPVELSRSPIEGGAVDSLDEETRAAIDRLRFREPKEALFREGHLAQNLPRARSATTIFLAMIVIVTAINLLGGFTPFTEAVLEPMYLLRLAVSCPALLVILLATYLPALRRHYQAIAAVAVVVNGLAVMTIGAIAAGSGQPQFQMGDVLVIVYATLFLGLLFRFVLAVAVCLVCAFVTIGLAAVLSAARVEHLMRTTFVETQLLNDIAERDGLSGLYNRRMFDTLTRRLWQQAQREQESLQVILVDIDHFKRFNDLYGHQAGDDCIRRVAGAIGNAARRPLDFCARYGGEEFALVLYAPSGLDSGALPEQLRRDIMSQAVKHGDSDAAGVITVSIGSAIAQPGSKRSLAGLIQAADEALYRAKQMGRNRVLHVDAGSSETPTGAFKVFAVR
jgi:diguanylate cyclase (GGDEF)-like protein